MPDWCWAGRKAKASGLWETPCDEPDDTKRQNMICAEGLPEPIVLCDKHFIEAQRLGLVSEPYIGEAEAKRRGLKTETR